MVDSSVREENRLRSRYQKLSSPTMYFHLGKEKFYELFLLHRRLFKYTVGDTIPHQEISEIPPGFIIHVGKRLDGKPDYDTYSLWLTIGNGKAELFDYSFPEGETEDLDWFTKWEIKIVGLFPPEV